MGSAGVGGSLSAASDVNLNSPTTGQGLKHSGVHWVNAAFTKADIGLSNVNNTSDADKPVSVPQAAAIAASGGGGGVTTITNLPAGSTIRVSSPVIARPTARTDITIMWVGYASAPVNAIQGDLWLELAA